MEEVMRAFDDLVRSGKVLYCGLSDTPAWVAAHAQTLAHCNNWAPLIGLQTEYSLIQRTPERELLPMALGMGMGAMAWAPIGGGLLSGKYAGATADASERRLQPGHKRLSERNMRIAGVVAELAVRKRVSSVQIAIQWVRRRGVIPIVGARTAAQMSDNLRSLDVTLTEEEMIMLDDASRIELGFPHDFLQTDSIRSTLYSGLFNRITS
jgi:aryl-alcohol dehydrogenase-like predicted oxidoreductase